MCEINLIFIIHTFVLMCSRKSVNCALPYTRVLPNCTCTCTNNNIQSCIVICFRFMLAEVLVSIEEGAAAFQSSSQISSCLQQLAASAYLLVITRLAYFALYECLALQLLRMVLLKGPTRARNQKHGGFLATLFRHNLQAFRSAGDPLPYLGPVGQELERVMP